MSVPRSFASSHRKLPDPFPRPSVYDITNKGPMDGWVLVHETNCTEGACSWGDKAGVPTARYKCVHVSKAFFFVHVCLFAFLLPFNYSLEFGR